LKNPEIDHFVSVVRRRWLLAAVICVIGIGLIPVFATLIPPAHKATAQLLLVSQALKDTTMSDPDLPSIVTSTEVLDRVIDRLKLGTNPIALAKKVKTKIPAKSSGLELTYQDKDGVKAATIANAIADESASYFHEVATRGYSDAITALNRRIAESKASIAMNDRLLQSNHAFATSDKVLDDLTRQIDDLRVQRGQLISTLAADKATALALAKQLRTIDPIVRGEILQKDVVYQRGQGEVARDAADLISERASFHESFPGLSALEKRVDRERGQLKSAEAVAVRNGAGLSPSATQTILDGERAAGAVAVDRERLRATDALMASEQQHLQQVARAGVAVGTLRAQRDAALQQYLALTQRLGAAQGDSAMVASLGMLVVVSRAVPGPSERGSWPLALGVLIVGLAIGAAYVADAIDRRLWGNREIENLYGRPVLIEVGGD
jgi:capsular polysaccharide biosynthesis protein